jgi:hypothetical protein
MATVEQNPLLLKEPTALIHASFLVAKRIVSFHHRDFERILFPAAFQPEVCTSGCRNSNSGTFSGRISMADVIETEDTSGAVHRRAA